MWLVLCAPYDLGALWAYRGLRDRGLVPIELVTGEALAYALRLEHRLEDGETRTRITLADGRTLDSAAIRGTLNRLQAVPNAHLQQAIPADREYAAQELYALFLSWLYGLPGSTINLPTPQGLCGAWRPVSQWQWLAGQAGLPTLPYRFGADTASQEAGYAPDAAWDTSGGVIVLDGACHGPPLPADIAAGCARLAALSGTRLLGIQPALDPAPDPALDLASAGAVTATNQVADLVSDPKPDRKLGLAGKEGAWYFGTATPSPDLRLGGQALLDALARALRQ